MPDDVDRLDYILLNHRGETYDHQQEPRYGRPGLRRKRSNGADAGLAQQVRAACRSGEGALIEFKPFVDCKPGFEGRRGRNPKLREIVRTVVAFANHKGGSIFLGIDDSCVLVRIQGDLAKAYEKEATGQAMEEYRGTLTNAIKDEISGHVDIESKIATVDDAVIVVVSVEPGRQGRWQ